MFECSWVVFFVGYRVCNIGGGVVFMFVVLLQDFQQWLGVGDIMCEEVMEEVNVVLVKMV